MRTFSRPLARHLLALSFFSALPLACGGELYLNANDAIPDYDPIDRDGGDANGNDDDNGGDENGGDFSGGDNIIGDGFGGGDDTPTPCGFGGACPSGQECIEGGCVQICNETRCGASQLCCANEGTRTECTSGRCQEPCPHVTDLRCGAEDQLCCDVGANQTCGASLTCVQNCTGQGPLCGNGTAVSFGSVCCNGRAGGTTEDDDVCVFDKCVQRGGVCESFLDCDAGEYCELTLHEETGGEPDTGYCLPNDFPPDAPICQEAPTNLFVPITEWSWVGIQLVGTDTADTDFSNNFVAGQVIPKCATAASTNCYREPCTDLPSTTAPNQSANLGSQCFRSVETIPTTADIDHVDLDPSPGGDLFVPEVAFKAYADGTFGGVNLLVLADGRADSALPATGTPSKQQRSKAVIYGGTRGHLAIGNLDGDPQLEIAEAHAPGFCVYDPYDTSGNLVANALKGACLASGSLNTNFTGGAPHLADLDGDGDSEIIIAGVVIGYNGTAPSVLLDLGAAEQGGESNPPGGRCGAGQDCFNISTVADVNLDNFPELLTGEKAWTIRHNPVASLPHACGQVVGADPTWQADCAWQANWGALTPVTGVTLGKGFPGVGDFVNNTQSPYASLVNTPEVAVVYDGAAYILSGENGSVLRSRVSTTPLAFKLLNNRGGPPNIADFDGDGRVEVSFAGTGCMVVVDPDCATADAASRVTAGNTAGSGCAVPVPTLSDPPQRVCNVEVQAGLAQEIGVLWQYQTQDQSSAVTGTSVFDFQGDGKAEVLYNDECFFRVFEGATSHILYERPNSHRTATEYPIVVDVDGDSNSEIVVVSTGDQSSRYTSGRDRCGGPALNTPLGQTNCAAAGNARACGSLGGCGWLAGSCQTCAQLASQAACAPAIAATPSACTARGGTTPACFAASGGCGLTVGNQCRACNTFNGDQARCDAASGCWYNTAGTPADNKCYPTCDTIKDGSDGDATIDNECNATPNCVMIGAVCAFRPNGCTWNGNACLQSCGGAYDAADTDGSFDNECNAEPSCRALQGTCREWAYRRSDFEQYTSNACSCTDHPVQAECDAARGCRWNGSSCVVVTADNSAGNCGSYGDRTSCQAHMDDCIWDAFQGGGGLCEENPRGQAYVCMESTWGVTAFGDPSDQWVRTLPYWHEHAFHITDEDRFGTVVPDWHVCYPGAQCAAQTAAGAAACEATFITGSSGATCSFGVANPDFYNNFRQNVPGFVPLNAPDLRVETAVADLRTCPPSVKIIARVVNKGRAGIKHDNVDITFYRLASESQTYQQTIATTTPFATVQLPVDLLPGGAVDIGPVIYTIPSNEAPIDLDFRVIANPAFLANPSGTTFECNGTNNFKDVLNIDCTSTGG